MFYIECSGSPREVGVQHGRFLREEIARAFAEWKAETWLVDGLASVRERMLTYLGAHYPEMIEEMEGIAEGAGVDFDVPFALTAFNSVYPALMACSVFAVRSKEPRGCVGKTHDIGVVEQRWGLAQRIAYKNGMTMIRCGSVGSLWTVAGINERGIAVGTASAPRFTGQDGFGVPQHAGPTPVLYRCRTVAEAIDEFSGMIFAGKGLNMALADAGGDVAAIEKSFDRQSVRHPKKGPAYATNHYLGRGMAEHLPKASGNSVDRFEKLKKVLRPGAFADPVAKLKQVCSDPSEPGAICRAATLTAFVCDPGRGQLWVCPGTPTVESWVCLRL
ncbi:MAG: C45 family peptidase [Planctomycetota bacterium]